MITISLNLLIAIIVLAYCILLQILNIWYRTVNWESYSLPGSGVFWIFTIIIGCILTIALFTTDLASLLV